jgi:hypothetical protein
MISLSKVGMGQSFTVDLATSKAYPSINCDQTTFILTNNTGSTIWYRLYVSADNISNWIDISLAGAAQRLNAGATFSINVQSDGFYKIYYASTNAVSLSSSSLPSIQTLIKSSPTISTEVSSLNDATCLNTSPNILSVTASAGSGNISQYAWYSNTISSNSGGTLSLTSINSSSTDNFTPIYSIVGDSYYYPVVTNSNGCSTSGSVSGKITVNPLPSVTITNPAAVCSPSTIDLTATSITSGSTSSLTYSYYTDAAATTALSTPSLVNTTGTYYIKGVTAASCYRVEPVIATINPLPSVTITNPAAVCSPSTIDLTATSITSGSTSSLTYSYYTDAAATTALSTPSLVNTTGTYYIKGVTDES